MPKCTVIPDLYLDIEDIFDVVCQDYKQGYNAESKEIDKFQYDVVDDCKRSIKTCPFDGSGIVDLDIAEQWAKDLGLDYIPGSFQIRLCGVKGCLFVMSIKDFVDKISKTDKIMDIDGNVQDYSNGDFNVILTESMFKYKKFYCEKEKVKQWKREFHKPVYGYERTFNICSFASRPDDLKDELLTAYQPLQTMDELLDMEKEKQLERLDSLCGRTVETVKSMHSDIFSFLKHIGMDEEGESNRESVKPYYRALAVNHSLCNDRYIRMKMERTLESIKEKTYVGKLYMDGSYTVVGSDPFALLQHAFGLKVTGLLDRDEIYSDYWNKRNVHKVNIWRNPHIFREHWIGKCVDNDKTSEWFKYLNANIIVSVWDTNLLRCNSADTDGDTLASVKNEILENEVEKMLKSGKARTIYPDLLCEREENDIEEVSISDTKAIIERKAYGINLDRTAQAQYNQNIGVKVSKEELQPGDLVFFNGHKGSGGVGHVGIYVGNGQFVHEPGSGQTAKVSYLSERNDFVGGKRYGGTGTASSAVSYNGTSSGTYTKTVPGIDANTLAKYQKLVREGSFDVETITNDKLKEAIKSYQEWYDKMKSCRDKIDELNGTLKELYKTMAEIPIEKRDRNVDALETILGIRESKRDNINAVIVDPKKYASTKKAFKTAKAGLSNSLKTKAQKTSSGLSDAEFKTLKSCIKSGKAVPKKILDSITDGALYSRCSEYNDAFYTHSQYADAALSAGEQIKRFNALSNQILSAEKAATKQYKAAYKSVSKDYAASLKKVSSTGKKAEKAATAKCTGLTKKEINRIKSCIKSGKLIDSDLMLQLESTGAYNTFLEYNKAVLAGDAEKEVLDSASFDYEKQRQQEIGKIQEIKTSRHQNIADKADEKVSRNNALMENEASASGKNKYLKDNNRLLDVQYKHLIEIAKLENNLVEAAGLEAQLQSKKNENTRQAYQNLADEHAAKADYYQALEDNAVSYKDKNSNEAHRQSQMKYQYLNLIKAAFGNELEQKRLAEELQSKINESYKTMFDNIRTGYEQTISLISSDISDIDNEVKKVQASGRLVDASFYNFKMSMEEKNLGVLREEEASLLEQLKNVKMYSSEWYECQDAIQSVQNAQADALVTIKEYKDAVNETANTIQNDIVSAFHDINNEADLLTTLLGDNLSDSDIGGLTQDGLAVLSLYVSQLNVSQDAAKSLHDEIDSMQNAADNGILSFIDANGIKRDYASIHDLEKDIRELYSTYQDEIKGTYDYESKIIDLMKQKYQSELDYLKDLIDKKKESLEAEKDLYEYSKNIKGQVSSINSLRKQTAALQGDTSTETDARVQKLQSQLKDAEEELKDTEYDRYISDQEAMLDNLYNEYAELLTDLEKNRDRLLQEGLDLFAQTGSDVQDTIRDTVEQYNYRVTSAMDGIISSIENMGSLSDYFSVGGTVTQSLDNIASEIQKAYTSLSAEIAKGNASVTIDSTGNTSDGTASIGQTGKYDTYGDSASSGNSGGTSNTADRPSTSKPINLSALANASGAAGAGAYKTFIENFLKKGTNKYDPKTTSSLNKYIHEKYGSALTVGEMSTLSKYLGLNYSASDLAAENKNHQKYKKNILDTLKLQGFSKGGIVKDLEDAVRANGDSVIVSAQPGEAVLTKEDTENLQRFTKSLKYEELSRKLEKVMHPMPAVPDLSTINAKTQAQEVLVSPKETAVNVEFGNVDINLPNVMDYADFMTMAQHDPKFERLVASIMCSNLTGKNYLAKNSIIFNH